jgi:hypothetical protein
MMFLFLEESRKSNVDKDLACKELFENVKTVYNMAKNQWNYAKIRYSE